MRIIQVLVATLFIGVFASAAAQDKDTLLRIGTGGSGGSYFPIGSRLSQELNSSDALLALAQRSNGSVANVQDIATGLLELALAQADVVHWAYHGKESFNNSGRIGNLRTIASLYLESFHFVVRAGSGIESLKDLAGKRVSAGEIGSGTQINVPRLLNSQGVATEEIKWVYVKTVDAIERLRRGNLDAFFMIAGYPVAGLTDLAESGAGRIMPINLTEDSSLRKNFPFITFDQIPADTYGNHDAIDTLAVPAQLVVDANLDTELVAKITELLWNEKTLQSLIEAHSKADEIEYVSAMAGLSAPLHEGAEMYYRAMGHPFFDQE